MWRAGCWGCGCRCSRCCLPPLPATATTPARWTACQARLSRLPCTLLAPHNRCWRWPALVLACPGHRPLCAGAELLAATACCYPGGALPALPPCDRSPCCAFCDGARPYFSAPVSPHSSSVLASSTARCPSLHFPLPPVSLPPHSVTRARGNPHARCAPAPAGAHSRETPQPHCNSLPRCQPASQVTTAGLGACLGETGRRACQKSVAKKTGRGFMAQSVHCSSESNSGGAARGGRLRGAADGLPKPAHFSRASWRGAWGAAPCGPCA